MKKLLLTLLISLNLAMPAHAFVAGMVSATGPMAFIMYMNAGSLNVLVSQVTDDSILAMLFMGIGIIFDSEKNSENNFVPFNVADDIDSLVSAKIYTETEGNTLKSELSAFMSNVSASEKKAILSDAENLQNMSPEDIVNKIESKTGVSKLLAEYFASKIGIQVL